ncbi:MAG: NAD(P)/FAD-dependent oxidoreductase [Chloroflexota bacterium]
MSLSADVVVIGGGVNGTSLAWHLAKRGMSVILLEKGALAAGASGKSGALVRMHYTDRYDAALAWQSMPYFKHWGDVVGPGDPVYTECGMIRIVPNRFADRLRANIAMLKEVGVNTDLVTASEVAAIDPGCFTGDFDVAAWEPESGYADPVATTHSFAKAAASLGARIHEGVAATGIETRGERVTGVTTALGTIATGKAVVAAGAWANALLNPLGLDYGLRTNRVQITIMRRTADDQPTHPVLIDGLNNTWLRPEGDYATLCGIGRDQLDVNPDLYAEGVEQEYLVDAQRRCAKRRPALANAFMRGGWGGIITMSPDGHAILGQLEPYAGLYGILGDSGTNFKTAPGIGANMAALIAEGASDTVDLRPFRASRIAEGAFFAGEHEYGDSLLDVFR